MTQSDARADLSALSAQDLGHRLASENWNERVTARKEFERRGISVAHTLGDLLESGTATQRWEAAKALQTIRATEALPALIAALRDNDGSVRWIAAEALAAIGKPAVAPVLRELGQHSDSAWLREGAHHVLTANATPAVSPVIHALESAFPGTAVLAHINEALHQVEGDPTHH